MTRISSKYHWRGAKSAISISFLSDKILYNEDDIGLFCVACAIYAFNWDEDNYWEDEEGIIDSNNLQDWNYLQTVCRPPSRVLAQQLLEYSAFPALTPQCWDEGWDLSEISAEWTILWEKNLPVNPEIGEALFDQIEVL